jgi:hypothetical protein
MQIGSIFFAMSIIIYNPIFGQSQTVSGSNTFETAVQLSVGGGYFAAYIGTGEIHHYRISIPPNNSVTIYFERQFNLVKPNLAQFRLQADGDQCFLKAHTLSYIQTADIDGKSRKHNFNDVDEVKYRYCLETALNAPAGSVSVPKVIYPIAKVGIFDLNQNLLPGSIEVSSWNTIVLNNVYSTDISYYIRIKQCVDSLAKSGNYEVCYLYSSTIL